MAEQTAIDLKKCEKCGADVCGAQYLLGNLQRIKFSCGTEIWYDYSPEGVTYKGPGCDVIADLTNRVRELEEVNHA